MSTLRDQSAPVLYGLVVLFILAMGGFGSIFSSTSSDRGNSENCDPERFVACSDNQNISITVEEYFRRYNNNPGFFHNRANPFGPNSPYSATDQQLDTINALNQVWSSLINEKVNSQFVSDLELVSEDPNENSPHLEEILAFIKNYPNFNPTYKAELEILGLFMVDSTFNQVLYEASVDNGILYSKLNDAFALTFPQQDLQIKTQGSSRWNNWFSTMKRQLANVKLNYIINSTQSLSELELKDQLLLEQGIYNLDYLTYSLSDIEVEITDNEIQDYYNSIKDDESYNLKKDTRRVVQFVKWNMNDLNENEKDSIKKLAKDFRKSARRNGFDTAVEKNNTYSLSKEITLSNEFSLSGSGLGTQTKKLDGSSAPFYNIIGAGRKIIEFAFTNDIGEIKLLNINSDRKTNGFNDIGIFHIKEELSEGYIPLEESGIKDRLEKELTYAKKCELAKVEFNSMLNNYSDFLSDLSQEDIDSFDPLSYWLENDEAASKNILIRNHKGSINDFLLSFINTDLRNTLISIPELKGFLLTLDEGLDFTMNPIDNESIVLFRVNELPDENSMDLSLYKSNELEKLKNTQSSLFLEDQKETANIKDNRTQVIY
tara:strand:- start:5945 stop:7747 length:1803 start_codon:yes stop_codon:yes gene_type:complete